MAQTTVTASSSTTLAEATGLVIQNLGPGVLYVGGDDSTGVKVDVGQAMAVGQGVSGAQLYADSDDCDVRYFNSTGLFAAPSA